MILQYNIEYIIFKCKSQSVDYNKIETSRIWQLTGVTMTLFRSLRRESHSRWFRSLVTPWTLPLLAREGVSKRRRPTCWLELGRLAVSPLVGCRSLKHP